jgi:hypothetical protein
LLENKPVRVLLVSWALLVIGLAAAAGDRGDHGPANENTEVLWGGYHCGVSFDSDEAYEWLSFEASGDVFHESPYPYRRYPDAAASPEICDGLAATAAEIIRKGGCAAGAIEASGDETGTSRDFQFVCQARRSALISLIAEVLTQHLTGSP